MKAIQSATKGFIRQWGNEQLTNEGTPPRGGRAGTNVRVFMCAVCWAQGGPGPKQAQLTEPVCRRLSGVVLGNLIRCLNLTLLRTVYSPLINVSCLTNS
jgi:hypothetical protein